MGYDVCAGIIQGWKLNDFFESHCEDEIEHIRDIFEEYMEDENGDQILSREDKEGVGIDQSGYESGEYYIGLYVGANVSNRGGPNEATFELKNPVLVAFTVIRVMKKVDEPLFQMIADMMETRPIKNYLLLSEG